MRTLVISDVHANFEALRRIPENFDQVICLGDLVDYGPSPAPCLSWVRAHEAFAIRGNHDHAVATRVDCRCSPSMHDASVATREHMWALLGDADREYLATLPIRANLTVGGVRYHLVHATPADPLYTYLGPAEEKRWAGEVEKLDADVVLVGHTHLPMVLRFGKKTVVNPGSVGQPRDGDPRAAYAVIEDGEPRLERVAYDVERTVAGLARCGLPRLVFQQLASMLRTGGASH